MSEDFLERLRRLGVTRGARDLKPARRQPVNGRERDKGAQPSEPASLQQLIPNGRVETHESGACFVVDHVYGLHHTHGRSDAAALLRHTPAAPARFLKLPELQHLNFRDFLFLDTETTGLAGAATLAFMVGVAFFEQSAAGEALVVRQFFLRDHGDEPAMLAMLDQLAGEKAGLITFNGRNFDVPLLRNRYLMNRSWSQIEELPHLDLLSPARRLWRGRLGSVALGNLEKELLGIRRTSDDIPGWLIPAVYNDYVRSGDARDLARVFYHNKIDMLSMVTLATEVARQLEMPEQIAEPIDQLSVGRWQADLGFQQEAELTLRQVLEADLPLDAYHQALQKLGLLLKRADRHAEAVPFWQQWAASSLDDVGGFEELAKFYEWREKDLAAALQWTERALALVKQWSSGQAAVVRPQLLHRQHRLRRKLDRQRSG